MAAKAKAWDATLERRTSASMFIGGRDRRGDGDDDVDGGIVEWWWGERGWEGEWEGEWRGGVVVRLRGKRRRREAPFRSEGCTHVCKMVYTYKHTTYTTAQSMKHVKCAVFSLLSSRYVDEFKIILFYLLCSFRLP